MFQCIILQNKKQHLFETCSMFTHIPANIFLSNMPDFFPKKALCDQGNVSQSKETLGSHLENKNKFKMLSR